MSVPSVDVAAFTRTERLLLSVQFLMVASILWAAEVVWSLKRVGSPSRKR